MLLGCNTLWPATVVTAAGRVVSDETTSLFGDNGDRLFRTTERREQPMRPRRMIHGQFADQHDVLPARRLNLGHLQHVFAIQFGADQQKGTTMCSNALQPHFSSDRHHTCGIAASGLSRSLDLRLRIFVVMERPGLLPPRGLIGFI